MVNKLQIVRIDNFAVQKVDLQIGDNIIGRGAATGHVDNPIVEQAVTINLAPTGEMTMTPMLACYMKSSRSNRWQSLKVGCTVAIQCGDICSLLPHKSWFKITSTECGPMEEDNDANGKRKAANSSEEEPPDKKLRSDSSVETIYSQSRSVLDEWDTDVVVPEEADGSTLNNTNDVPNDPSAVRDTHSSKASSGSSSVEVTPADGNDKNVAAEAAEEVTSPSVGETTGTECTCSASANETSSNSRDEAGKKIKWDCGRHFSDQADQQVSESAEELGESSAPPVEDSSAPDEAAASTDEPPRNKCTYGSQCYRRNSEHRARFSHPGDDDYDVPDPRPECPYGVRCYRKNPQHKRDFKHTKNRRTRAQTPVRATAPDDASGTEQSSAEESVDESDYEPSLYDGTSDDCMSEFEDKSDFDGASDGDDK